MKVKIFTNAGEEAELEKEINEWLSKNSKIKISHIKQSYAYNNDELLFNTIISVWYGDSFEY